MHDRAVRPGARDGRKAEVAEMLALAAEGLEPVARRRSRASSPARRFAREPGEEARQRRAVAAMRRARAVDLDRVLAGLGQLAGIGGAMNLRARRSSRSKTHAAAVAGSASTRSLPAASASSAGAEAVGRRDRHARCRDGARASGRELAPVDEEIDRAVADGGRRRTAAAACAARRRRGC